jgi:hypothetical protein
VREQVLKKFERIVYKLRIELAGDFSRCWSSEMSEHIFQLKTLEDCLKNVLAEDLKDLKTHIYGRSNE